MRIRWKFAALSIAIVILGIAAPSTAGPIMSFNLSGDLTYKDTLGTYIYKDVADRFSTFTGTFSYDAATKRQKN